MTQGPEQLLNKFTELKVRSWVIKKMAYIYIERHVQDLADRPGVLTIHRIQKCASVKSSLEAHVDERVKLEYPAHEYDTEQGQILPEITASVVEGMRSAGSAQKDEHFDMRTLFYSHGS